MKALFFLCTISITVSFIDAAFIVPNTNNHNGLSGKFIHVTDFHLDPNYLQGASVDSKCHRPASNTGNKGTAGKFGVLDSKCDSPLALVDGAFEFMKRQAPDADFVLYTGDSVRHDRDTGLPRTDREVSIIEQTIVEKFSKSFSKVIPVIGNNDVSPHNNVSLYDIEYTRYRQIWQSAFRDLDFGYHFIKGGYYVQEILPNLRTINLNTMVFYKKNKLLKDDCDVADSPGRMQMDWFKQALQDARSQNSKAYILAHIPPNTGNKDKRSYKPKCYAEYYKVLGTYSDVILGHFSGHFNYDQLTAVLQNKETGDYKRVAALGKGEAPLSKENLEKHKVVSVLFHGPSIVPENNPAVRIYTYDTTGSSFPVGTIVDWEQYYVDLNEANESGRLEFKLEYTASELYGVKQFDVNGLQNAFEAICLDEGVRQAYATYHSVSSKEK